MVTTARDEQILTHVGRFRLSIPYVLERLYFEGRSCEDVVSRLVDNGLLTTPPKRLPGKYTYYQLSSDAARARDIPVYRTEPLAGLPLHKALAVLWFANVSEMRRLRLERQELLDHLGRLPPAPNEPYCLQGDPDPCIYRCIVPDSAKDIEAPIRTLKREAFACTNDEGMNEWLRAQDFRFVILVEREELEKKLNERLDRAKRDELPKHTHVSVTLAPGPLTLKDFISDQLL